MSIRICLFGGRGAGKDTVVEILNRVLKYPKQIRLAEYVVEACKAFGIDNPTRTDLVFVGQEIGRKMIDENVWINMALKDPANNIEWKDYIVSDVRYPNEYETFVNAGFIPVLIECDLDKRIERVIKRDGSIDMKLLEGESEQHYKFFEPEFVLNNNGTIDELVDQIIEMITQIGGIEL